MGGSSSAAWGQLPATGVSAVALNVTVTQATAPSFLTAWPAGYPRPATSNLNFGPGETVANHVIVRVGKEGWVNFYNLAGQAHVVLDLVGWYGGDDGDQFRGVSPARTLDTRSGKGAPVAAVGPGGTLGLKVAGEGGVPASGVSAVVLNVTATQPTAAAYLTAWPSGTARPQASSLNYVPGQTVSNLVTVKVGEDGKVNLFNSAGAVHLVADVAGWYGAGGGGGGRYSAVQPSRLLDTRSGRGAAATKAPAGSTLPLKVTGQGGVPASGVAAVALNVTVTAPTQASFLTRNGRDGCGRDDLAVPPTPALARGGWCWWCCWAWGGVGDAAPGIIANACIRRTPSRFTSPGPHTKEVALMAQRVGSWWIKDGIDGRRKEAVGFAELLGGLSQFDWTQNHGDSNVLEKDFVTTANWTERTDEVDAVMMSSHGNTDGFDVWDGRVTTSDAVDFGKVDLEVFATHACDLLHHSSGNSVGRWIPAFQRLHYLCGFHNSSYSGGGQDSRGWWFAFYAAWSHYAFFDFFDLPIREAWAEANEIVEGSNVEWAYLRATSPSAPTYNERLRASEPNDPTTGRSFWTAHGTC